MSLHPTFILWLLGGVVLPIGYVALCIWMICKRVWWFTYIAYFFLFGAAGGWCLTIPFPNGPILVFGVFLLYTAAALACLGSSLALQFRKQKSRFEQVALIGGYCYLAVLATVFISTVFFHS
jgi:hypothetical protein